MKRFTAFMAFLAAGCSSDPVRYPATDVLQVPGFEVKRGADLQQSGGTLQSGTLVYQGEGDLKQVFQAYVHAMEAEGWMTTYANFNSEVGTATLRKDKRAARLNFSTRKEKITATIQVTEAALLESK